MKGRNKNKIINDPIYGFVNIDHGLINCIINHAYFQRMRRISQLGLSYLVYPGAHHSRFEHAIGSLYLMQKAINQIKRKGNTITLEEEEGVKIAILLHDIGHGPFSHALEKSIISNVTHEEMSMLFMHRLNKKFDGKLSLAIKIFTNKYHKKFLHQLVSSQLDIDRLDYLKRDSFFTGVTEGNIGSERIIQMLNVYNNNIVIEEKGIYSVEKFLIARRLMYWQVYLHKNVIAAEYMLIQLLKRAKELIKNNKITSPIIELNKFLQNNYKLEDFKGNDKLLEDFSRLDDIDIYTCIKSWSRDSDPVLSKMSNMILNRDLLKINIKDKPFTKSEINFKISEIQNFHKLSKDEINFFVFSDKVSNNLYSQKKEKINILLKNNKILDISGASDQFDMKSLNKEINKYFICFPK